MRVINPGHVYEVSHLDGDGVSEISFVDRDHGRDKEGTTNQELLRVLIDRLHFLDSELPWEGNREIIFHLRQALVLHEMRHLNRLVDKGEIQIETLPTGEDGHLILCQEKSLMYR